MESKKNYANGHVGVFIYPFTSHPFVMFNLVQKLAFAAPNVNFTLFSSAKSNKSLLSKNNSTTTPSNILFQSLHDGSKSDGSDLFQEMEDYMMNAATPESFNRGIDAAESQTGRKFTCFLTDALLCSVVAKIVKIRNVSWSALWVLSPYSLPAFLSVDYIRQLYEKAKNPEEDLILDIIPGLPPLKYTDLPMQGLIESSGPFAKQYPASMSLYYSMTRDIQGASSIVVNSFQELHPDSVIDHVKSKFQEVLFLGALTLSDDKDSKFQLSSWLDEQKEESVVYISTGTVITWPQEECLAVAEALEASDALFLWTLRDELKDRLPSGFLERTKGKVVAWAPQSRILKHPSIGVFVTNCGSNSFLESVVGGVPMICRSVWADNHMTAKMIDEIWEIGVRIEGRRITKEAVMKSLETVFRDDKGKKIRENVKKLKQVLIMAAGPHGVAARDFKTLLQKISQQ